MSTPPSTLYYCVSHKAPLTKAEMVDHFIVTKGKCGKFAVYERHSFATFQYTEVKKR